MKGRKTLAAFLVESAAYRIFHDISISLANDIPLGSCFFLPPAFNCSLAGCVDFDGNGVLGEDEFLRFMRLQKEPDFLRLSEKSAIETQVCPLRSFQDMNPFRHG